MKIEITLYILSICFAATVASAKEPFEAFLETHCVHCHGPKKEKGDLRIDQLSRDFKLGADTHHWAEVIENINAGDMPPEDEPQPSQEDIAAFVAKLDTRIKEGKAARMAARPVRGILWVRWRTRILPSNVPPARWIWTTWRRR